MALRVLLADESSTIKKVMMLALQDFAVEVKSVPVGLDVLAVSKTYKPDIVFADVLLTKRNGYEVSLDLKNDSETRSIPVVLMWSGFMELDEAKASECKADRRLEKPFDADTLRGLVTELVTKTRTNPLSEYLTFPAMPEFEEKPKESTQQPFKTPLEEIHLIPEENTNGGFVINFDKNDSDNLDIPSGEEFSQVPLSHIGMKNQESAEDGGWAHQDLTKFKIQIPPLETGAEETDDFASKFVIPHEELSQAHIQVSGNFEEITFDEPKTKTKIQIPPAQNPQAFATLSSNIATHVEKQIRSSVQSPSNSAQLETQVNAQAREIIESICWKILPDIAERVVREEIQKILRDT